MVRLVWPLGAWDYVRQFGLLGPFFYFPYLFLFFYSLRPVKNVVFNFQISYLTVSFIHSLCK